MITLVLGVLTQAAAYAFGVDLPLGDTVAGAVNLWPLGVFFGGVTVLLAGLTRRERRRGRRAPRACSP